jgi:intracellular septation protein A
VKTTSAHVIVLPGAREIIRKAGSTILVASLLPAAVFYVTFSLTSLRVAVAVTLAWYYAGLLWTHARGKPLLAAAMLGAGLLTLRAVLAFWTNSSFLYFLQPVAGTVATATAFAVTALAGRPVLDRLVHEFCPLPAALSTRLRANHYFRWVSVVWTLAYLVNAVGTVWLLSTASLGGFLMLRAVLSPLLVTVAVIASYVLFRVMMRHENVHLTRRAPAPVLATA